MSCILLGTPIPRLRGWSRGRLDLETVKKNFMCRHPFGQCWVSQWKGSSGPGQANLCSDSFFHWVISPPAQLPEPTSWSPLPPHIRPGKHREGDAFGWGWLPSYLPPHSPTRSCFSCSVVSSDGWLAQWAFTGTNEIITKYPPTWVLVSLAHSRHIHDSLSYKCMLLFGQRELRKSHP